MFVDSLSHQCWDQLLPVEAAPGAWLRVRVLVVVRVVEIAVVVDVVDVVVK